MEEKNEKPMTADQTTTDQTAEDPAVLEQEALERMTVEEGFEKIEEILPKDGIPGYPSGGVFWSV